MKAVLIQPQKEVPPGRVLNVLEALKWEAEVLLMEKGCHIPSSLKGYDCLVLLGGTMNVDDVEGYPYLEELRSLTAEAMAGDFPVLGLCLGAQMMSRAAGHRVHRNKCGELGWCEIRLTDEGMEDRIFAGVEKKFEVFHWHEDMFDLPEKSVLLGKSGQCPNQVIRMGEKSYGFQFHPEVSEEIVLNWVKTYGSEVESKLGPGGAARLIRETGEKMPLYHSTCMRILTNYFRNIEGNA